MSKKGDRLRDRAEELRVNADNIRVEECHPLRSATEFRLN
jgi:hypothetical protein